VTKDKRPPHTDRRSVELANGDGSLEIEAFDYGDERVGVPQAFVTLTRLGADGKPDGTVSFPIRASGPLRSVLEDLERWATGSA
jgi:hypothetical protein